MNTKAMETILNAAIARMNETKSCYGFRHGEINGHKVACLVMQINTNSKKSLMRTWTVDGKRMSAEKVRAL